MADKLINAFSTKTELAAGDKVLMSGAAEEYFIKAEDFVKGAVKVGGRNLLLGTYLERETTLTGASNDGGSELITYDFSNYALENIKIGDTVTCSFDYEATGTLGGTIHVQTAYTSFNNLTGYITVKDSGHVEVTTTITKIDGMTMVRVIGNGCKATVKIKNLKVEFGRAATDWEWAPEENFTKIVKQKDTSLKDYVEPGTYFFNSAYAPADAPNGATNGWLIVLAPMNQTGERKQIWLRYGTAGKNDHETYMRLVGEGDSDWAALVVDKGDWVTVTNFVGADITADTMTATPFYPEYKRVGKTVYIRGRIGTASTYPGDGTQIIFTIPAGFRPKETVYTLQAMSGANIARVYVNSKGSVALEWMYRISNGERMSGKITWIDLNLTYAVD